jgi:hypothetical protein
MTDVNAQIEAAKQAAANSVGGTGEGAVVPQNTGQVPAEAAPAAPPPSLDTFDEGSMSVAAFFKPTPYGLLVPKDAEDPIKSFKGIIDMSEVTPVTVIKTNNPVRYFKTYDGLTTPEGTPWARAVAEAQSIQPSTKPYVSADIPVTLTEDAGGQKAGDRVGYSLSTTNRKAFNDFLKALDNAGLDRSTAKVEVAVGYEVKKSPDYTWGIVTFSLIGEAKDQ